MAVVAGTGLVLKGVKGDQGPVGPIGPIGPKGDVGAAGAAGAAGRSHTVKSGVPSAADGTDQPTGSTYQVLESGQIYTWNGTAFTDTGFTARGSQIFNGTGAFAAANYPKAVAGLDYYLQNDTGTLYPLVNG